MTRTDPCTPTPQPELLITPIPAAPGARRDLLAFAEPRESEDDSPGSLMVDGQPVSFRHRRSGGPLVRLPKGTGKSVVVADPASGSSTELRVLPTSLLTPEELLRPVADGATALAHRGELDPCTSRYVSQQIEFMLGALARAEAGQALHVASSLHGFLTLLAPGLSDPAARYLSGLTNLVLLPGALLASIIVLDKASIDGLTDEQRELYAKLLVAQLDREIKKLVAAGVNNTRRANLTKTRDLLIGSAGLPALLKANLKRATRLAQLQGLSSSLADAVERGIEVSLALIAAAGTAAVAGAEVLVLLRRFLGGLSVAGKVKKALKKKSSSAADAIDAVLDARKTLDAAKTPAQKAAAKKALDAAIKKSTATLKKL